MVVVVVVAPVRAEVARGCIGGVLRCYVAVREMWRSWTFKY